MTTILNKIIVLTLIVLSAFGARADVEYSFAGGAIPAESSALLVIEIASGDTIAQYNAERPLIPASIMKCVTTATLLDKVGEDWHFTTPVYTVGKVKDGVLHGDLLIIGDGDPTINSRHEPKSADFVAEIVEALKAKRITAIRGSIKVDETLWEGPAVNPQWASGDLSQSYGTGTHAFNFEDNATGKSSVKDPRGVFVSRLRDALQRAGITVENAETDAHARKILGEHRSAPVEEIMRSCMMRSDNQFAEALLRRAGIERGAAGSFEGAAAAEMKFWRQQGAPMAGVNIVDGSGLSRANRVTADFMAFVLEKMSGNPYYASFFPLAGQEGTLKKFMADTPLNGYLALKTGSMNGIQCYAGYKLDDNYAPTHIVVCMINGMSDRSAARARLASALLKIFEQ